MAAVNDESAARPSVASIESEIFWICPLRDGSMYASGTSSATCSDGAAQQALSGETRPGPVGVLSNSLVQFASKLSTSVKRPASRACDGFAISQRKNDVGN